ncbi:MAG: MerR family transcriptional regulator [Bacteroidota bacterium]
MAIYSIRDLEKLTGIKAHTIRMWEQRYGIVEPARTPTNIRYYTDDHLRHLFNVAILNRNGVKISKLAKMSPDEVADMSAELTQARGDNNSQIEALTLAMIDLDESAFEVVYSTYVKERGFEQAMMELIYPFLDKLQLLWFTSTVNPVQEKFIIHLIRNKIISAIDQLPTVSAKSGRPTVFIYAAETEPQELPFLYLQYLIRARRIRGIYLGNSVSLSELREICQKVHPDYVYTILQEPIPRQTIQGYIDQASQCIGDGRLLLTGAQLFISPVNLPPAARVLNGLPDTIQFLDELNMGFR